jgi:hypothetical protein
MDLRRAVALFGAMVVSMAGTMKVMQIFTLEIGSMEVTTSVACA